VRDPHQGPSRGRIAGEPRVPRRERPLESAGRPQAGRVGRAMSRLPADDRWARPEGVDDATVEACGTLGEAVERMERARGHLYAFHQLMGRADLLFGEA